MKLNVGDLVELVFEGTTFSGVITSVTPERVELAFTLNIFLDGPGKLTWPNGVDMDVSIGGNALTKLHLRLPLEQVAVVHSRSEVPPSPPAPRSALAPQPPPTPQVQARSQAMADTNFDLENLIAEFSDDVEPALAAPEPPPPEVAEPEPELAPKPLRERTGMWVDFGALVDGAIHESGESFSASTVLVSVTACVLRVAGGLLDGTRVQLKFTLGRDTFDLAGTVAYTEGPEIAEIAYDEPPSEVRVRMLRAVLGLAKPELRTQESWTYQLRNRGGS